MKMDHLKEFRTVKRNPRVSEKVSEVNCQGMTISMPLPPGSQAKESLGIHPVWLEMKDMMVQKVQEVTM